MAAARANNRVFEEYDPSVQWSFDAEADSLRISLPGFKKDEIRVLVDSHGRLRTHGERRIAGNRWSRFQKDLQLPANCNVEGIRAKFDNETLTITLPKKTPSPQTTAPVAPPAPTRPPLAASSQRIPPPALPEPPARPAPPPPPPAAVPAAPLAPAASQKQQPAERRPSLPRKQSAVEPPAPELPARLPSVPTPAAVAAKPEPPSLAAVPRPSEDEEAKRRERETMGKMEEDRKAAAAQEEEAAMGEMAMARQPRPASASRGLLGNVAVAAVVLLGITVYVWHTLRNAAGGAGDHGHGRMGAGSYGDEI